MEIKQSRPKGRPPVPESEKKGRNFTFRSRGDMHEQLSDAATKNQRSISEEIEKRLDASFMFDQRLRDLQTLWEKRYSDIADKAEANIVRVKELDAVLANSEQQMAELEKEFEALERSASLLDVLLGKKESSQDLMRSIALELMANPDWDGSKASRKAMADRIHRIIHPGADQ